MTDVSHFQLHKWKVQFYSVTSEPSIMMIKISIFVDSWNVFANPVEYAMIACLWNILILDI